MPLVFASQNEHKVAEIRALLPKGWALWSLNDLGWTEEIEETGETLEQNAQIKAQRVFEVTGFPCFSDDSGLEVQALQGLPGVHSARYAGPEKNDRKNGEKLLQALAPYPNRSAQFRTVIAFVDAKGIHWFSGSVKGNIIHDFRGDQGFGYDPIFVPEGWDLTFAEVEKSVKNKISHRAIAFTKFIEYLTAVEK